jgi:hypothetical protein
MLAKVALLPVPDLADVDRLETLGWKTPAEALDQYLRAAKRCVATTV